MADVELADFRDGQHVGGGFVVQPVAGVNLEAEVGGELAIIGDPSEASGDAPAAPAPALEPRPEPEARR